MKVHTNMDLNLKDDFYQTFLFLYYNCVTLYLYALYTGNLKFITFVTLYYKHVFTLIIAVFTKDKMVFV